MAESRYILGRGVVLAMAVAAGSTLATAMWSLGGWTAVSLLGAALAAMAIILRLRA